MPWGRPRLRFWCQRRGNVAPGDPERNQHRHEAPAGRGQAAVREEQDHEDAQRERERGPVAVPGHQLTERIADLERRLKSVTSL